MVASLRLPRASEAENDLQIGETAMNQPSTSRFPLVRDLASKSVDQAREAYNRFLEAARQAHDVVSSPPTFLQLAPARSTRRL